MKNNRKRYIILTLLTVAVLLGTAYEGRLAWQQHNRLQELSRIPTGTPAPVQDITVTPAPTSTTAPEPISTTAPTPTNLPTPLPTLTPTPLPTRIPTPVPDDEVVDEINEKNISVVHYYKNPEIRQELLIYNTDQEGQQVKKVGCSLMRNEDKTVWLENEDYWYENSVLGISTEFLDTLTEDYYVIRVLLDNGTEGTEVIQIHGTEEGYATDFISSRMGVYTVALGQYEQLHCLPVNTNGRKITDVRVNRKSILEDGCRLLFEGRVMEFDMPVLENMAQDRKLSVTYVLDDNTQVVLVFTFLEEEWKHPLFETGSFRVQKSDRENLVIALDWNGHGETDLKYIGFYGDERIDPAYWYTTKEAVVIKKEFLQSLNAGEYNWNLEFGVVGYYIQVIIQ